MTHFAKLISFIFHPIFIPLVSFLCYLQIVHVNTVFITDLPANLYWIIVALIFIFTFVLPLLGMNIMVSFGIIPDFQLREFRHRPPVILMSAMLMFCLLYAFNHLENLVTINFFGDYFGVIFGGIIVAILTASISFFWQISMHMTCISGLAGALFGLSVTMSPIQNMPHLVWINSLVLIAIGLTGFSRLYLKKHDLLQVLMGMIVGFSVEFIILVEGWYPHF